MDAPITDPRRMLEDQTDPRFHLLAAFVFEGALLVGSAYVGDTAGVVDSRARIEAVRRRLAAIDPELAETLRTHTPAR